MEGSTPSKFSIWMLAIRPKTLPAAIAPVLVGTSFVLKINQFVFLPALFALIGALLIQILSNLGNDYFDFTKGIDDETRVGPTRVMQSGLLTIKEMKIGIAVNLVLAMLIGIYLIFVGGLTILIIGVSSLIFALLYSGGPFPLSSIGLGDIFVFVYFGIIAVNGTFFVQALSWNIAVLIGSIAPGLLITAILVVNNYRDYETDKAKGKGTLVVFFGKNFGLYEYYFTLIGAYTVPFVLYVLFLNFNFWIFLPLLSLPMAVPLIKSMKTENGPNLNKTLAGTARLSLVYSLLLAIGIIL